MILLVLKSHQRCSCLDFSDNTAGILTTKNGIHEEHAIFALPILIVDNGNPPLTGTNTLTVTVCDCDVEVNIRLCRYGVLRISVEALVAIVACVLIISGKEKNSHLHSI